jgi:hypothetical protein
MPAVDVARSSGGRRSLLAGLALAGSLLLPWFEGTDDGEPLTIPGWDTEPGFTASMLACACVVGIAGHRGRWLIVALATVIAIALTVWMLPRGDRYSGYDLGPGAFIALGIAVVVLAAAANQVVRSRA